MTTTIVRALSLVILALAVTGCATPRRYDWNQYDQRLYEYYKNPEAATEFVSVMEAHVRSLEATGKKPAPGLYAELGTFYLRKGDAKTAVQYYNKEMLAWPESKGLMVALITNADKPKPTEAK